MTLPAHCSSQRTCTPTPRYRTSPHSRQLDEASMQDRRHPYFTNKQTKTRTLRDHSEWLEPPLPSHLRPSPTKSSQTPDLRILPPWYFPRMPLPCLPSAVRLARVLNVGSSCLDHSTSYLASFDISSSLLTSSHLYGNSLCPVIFEKPKSDGYSHPLPTPPHKALWFSVVCRWVQGANPGLGCPRPLPWPWQALLIFQGLALVGASPRKPLPAFSVLWGLTSPPFFFKNAPPHYPKVWLLWLGNCTL